MIVRPYVRPPRNMLADPQRYYNVAGNMVIDPWIHDHVARNWTRSPDLLTCHWKENDLREPVFVFEELSINRSAQLQQQWGDLVQGALGGCNPLPQQWTGIRERGGVYPQRGYPTHEAMHNKKDMLAPICIPYIIYTLYLHQLCMSTHSSVCRLSCVVFCVTALRMTRWLRGGGLTPLRCSASTER